MLCLKPHHDSAATVAQFLSTQMTTCFGTYLMRQNGHNESRGQDCAMHYQLGNIYNLCPQAVSVYQLIVKSKAINYILNVEIISGVGTDCCPDFIEI